MLPSSMILNIIIMFFRYCAALHIRLVTATKRYKHEHCLTITDPQGSKKIYFMCVLLM